MNKQEARKHHYIPRFILKNFNDSNNQVNYWNIEKSILEKRNIKSVFMNKDMYRDESLDKEDPTKIESNFSKFEMEIAELVSNKLLKEKEIILTRKELEKLRIFISLLSFRSDYRMNQYKNKKFDEITKNILLKYQSDGDFEKLWKRELNILTTCRDYNNINNSDELDPIIKKEFFNELTGYYMTIVDARGGQFILADIYPTCEIFPSKIANVYMHYLLPISPNRMILLNHIMFKKELKNDDFYRQMISISKIKDDAIIPPKTNYENYPYYNLNDKYIYKAQKIYANTVEYLNALALNETNVGIIFNNSEKVIDSIIKFNSINGTKQKFFSLEKELKNKCKND